MKNNRKFSISAEIVVSGDSIKSRQDAIGIIQTMLNDYEDNNKSDSNAVVSIRIQEVR